jgi:HAD superfamily hydrolase (TIGR01509 family)
MQLIIWDFDGTLADTRPIIEAGMDHALKALGLDGSVKQEWLKCVGLPVEVGIEQTFGPLGLAPEVVMPAYRSFNHAEHEAQIQPFAGMTDLLQELHGLGVAMAVASSKRRVPLCRQISQLGWDGLFEPIVTPDEVTAGKPDPESLELCLKAHGLRPEQAVMVGDAGFDLDMARRAGVPSVAVGYGFADHATLLSYGPRAYAPDTQALRDILLAWRES